MAVSAQCVLVRAVAPPLLRAVVDDASLLDGALLVGGTLRLHPLVVDHQHAGCLDRAQRDGLYVPSRRVEHLVQVDGHHPDELEHNWKSQADMQVFGNFGLQIVCLRFFLNECAH